MGSQASAKWNSLIQQPQELFATASDEQYLTANSVSVAADTHERSAVMIFAPKPTMPFQFCALRFIHQGKATCSSKAL